MAEQKSDPNKSNPEKDVKEPNLIEKAKEASRISHHSEKSPRHDKETHGLSDDIDEDTPIDEVKGPGVLERAKEEIEALVGSILPKKKIVLDGNVIAGKLATHSMDDGAPLSEQTLTQALATTREYLTRSHLR